MSHPSEHLLALSQVSVELTSGIDALYLSGRAELPTALVDDLEVLRAMAVDDKSPVAWKLGGTSVEVLGRSFGKYRFAIRHELALIGLTASEKLPAIRVQPTSIALHALGPAGTVLWVRNIFDAAGTDVRLQVARLDLHSDWQGLWIEPEERRSFVTYSDRRALYEVSDELSGLNFGKRGGAVYARIYDKTRELESKGDDWWHELWGAAFDPEQRVLRIEFEFSRDGLREFDIDTPEDAFANVSALWAYATGNWLSLRTPTVDETRSRWPLDPRWQAVQQSALANNSLPATRIRSGDRAGSLRKLMPQLVGYLASAAVHLGTADLDDTCQALYPLIDAYGAQAGISFPERVEAKRRIA
jgi:hypothetical protein